MKNLKSQITMRRAQIVQAFEKALSELDNTILTQITALDNSFINEIEIIDDNILELQKSLEI